ncbi:MAG: ATP-binding cassette domain-containing protein, partial [Sphingomonadales bacterium]
RVKMLERMEPVAALSEDASIALHFPSPDYLPPPLITLDGVAVGYDDKPVLKRLNLRIDMEDRIALLGPNGAGKSTMAKLLSGRLKAMEGEFLKPPKLRVGYFAQHQLDEMRPAESAYEHMSRLMPNVIEAKVRARLGQFGFSADKADRPVETLSGGEKARLLFCLITYDKPHLLILDEPTNHLDLDARQALVQALNAYEGAVLLISHDRFLIEACVDDLYIIEKQSIIPFKGDLNDYAKKIIQDRRAESSTKAKTENKTVSAKDARRAAAEKRQKLLPFKRAIRDLEVKIGKLEAKQAKIEESLAQPELYDGSDQNVATVAELQKEQKQVQDQISDLEAQWLQVQEDLEKEENLV